LKDTDGEVMKALTQAAVVYQIVLTKADKIKPTELDARLRELGVRLAKEPAAHPVVRATSAETGAGIAELRAEIAQLVGA
jgi:GTP-binding protein